MRVTSGPPRRAMPTLNLLLYDLIVICSSAGKDSMALLAYLATLIREQGYRGRVVVLHNHLGVTVSGEPVEWWAVEALARSTPRRTGSSSSSAAVPAAA